MRISEINKVEDVNILEYSTFHMHTILHASSNTHETWTSVSYDLDVSLVLKEGSKNKKEYLQKKREGRTNPKVVNKCDNFLLPFILFSFNYTDS